MNIFQRIWNFFFKPKEQPVISNPTPVAPTNPSMGGTQPKPEQGSTRFFDKNKKFLINSKVLELTKHFEGFEPIARDDGYGTPTIGYGRINYPDGRKVRNGDRCTEAEAQLWLMSDLFDEGAKYVRAFLKDEVENNLTDDEMAVWVDFTFNRGAGRFRDYIAGYLNQGNKTGALASLVTVNTAAGRYSLGLDRRRWAERYILEGKDWKIFKDLNTFVAFKNRGYK